MTGKVYLVGSGPGGTGLLTQRAADLIEKADVIFYDQLPGEEIPCFPPKKSSEGRLREVRRETHARTARD